jgi:hypothetical protein
MPSYNKKISLPGKSAQELFDKVSKEIDPLFSKLSIGKVDLVKDPAKKQIQLKSSMVTAVLSCSDGELKLDGKLSLLATPFKSKIDETIDRWVAKHFSA